MNFLNSMLAKRSQEQKAIRYMNPFIQNIRNKQIFCQDLWIQGDGRDG